MSLSKTLYPLLNTQVQPCIVDLDIKNQIKQTKTFSKFITVSSSVLSLIWVRTVCKGIQQIKLEPYFCIQADHIDTQMVFLILKNPVDQKSNQNYIECKELFLCLLAANYLTC